MEPIDEIKSQPKSEKRVLFENFTALAFLQVAHYLLPIITIPYLVRVLQPDLFGLVYGAQYLIQYFITLTDYGFHFSATRLISIHRENKEKLNAIVSAVFLIRFALLLVALLIMILLIFVSQHYTNDALVYLLTFGMVIGNVFFPVWFFQGMEKMKIVTIIQIVSKIIFALGIFVMVQSRADYFWVPILQSAGTILAGIISLIILFNTFRIKFVRPKKEELVLQLTEGWSLFTSTIATTLYVQGNGLMLTLYADRVFVGYYAAGEKLIRAVASLFIPVSTALFPFISRKFHDDKKAGLHYFFKALLWVGLLSFIVSVITFFFGTAIGSFILGTDYDKSNDVIQILAFVPFVGSVGSLFAYQLFVHVGWRKALPAILFLAAILNFGLNSYLDPLYFHLGASYSLLITELFVPIALISYFILNRKKIV